MNLPKKLFISDPVRGQRFVGTLKKGNTGLIFRKDVLRKKHYMDVVKGYGVQKTIFDRYLRGKKGVIQIKELDTGRFLVASIDTWLKHSKSGNYGDGKQIFLSRKFMHNAEDFNRRTISTRKEEVPSFKGWYESRKRLAEEFKKLSGAEVALRH